MLDAVFLRRLKPPPRETATQQGGALPEIVGFPEATAEATTLPESWATPRQELGPGQADLRDRERAHDVATEAPLPATASGLAEGVDQSLVAWLLQEAAAQWAAVAKTVEQAVAEGARVIAVAGGARGEGRTTLVAGLAATLQARGKRAMVVAGSLAETGETLLEKGSDQPVVIVDAGIWFPPGPIRRDRLATLSAGCDAVILVRRAVQPPSPARAAAIAQTGCRLLGEVLTFEEACHAVA
jgi:Mrp family chromosome partitioning ATPase